jgi:hypothetical protein
MAMANILQFPARRDIPGTRLRQQSLATVIIFPGSRIERREFMLADRGKSAKGLPKQSRTQALDLDKN